MAESNVIKFAKGTNPSAKKTMVKKPIAKKPVEKSVKLTAEEERNIKAKETVEKLLEDSPIITFDKKEEVLEINEVSSETSKGVEWLEEQVTLLTEKNEALTAELTLVKEDYKRLFQETQQFKSGMGNGDDNVKIGVLQLFNEIQENHIKLGVNEQGIGNFRIYCPGFLNRMIKFFPFLEEYKRY